MMQREDDDREFDSKYDIGDFVKFNAAIKWGYPEEYIGTIEDIDFRKGKLVYYISTGSAELIIEEEDIIDYSQ